MAKDNRIRMPSSGGGIVRYFEDEVQSMFMIKPKYVIFIGILMVVLLTLLHIYGPALLGF